MQTSHKTQKEIDLLTDPPASGEHIYTVSEIAQDIKRILGNNFAHQVWVEGEISNFNANPSGHFYFSLKDEGAVLAAAMFARANKGLKFKLENGLKVVCFGKINAYLPRSQYQLIIERIEPKGIGAQQLAFEQLKNKLFKEGLFDPAHKRPLPFMPFSAGIVTSSAGAAVWDILQILKKGAACVDVVIRPARVQGEEAAKEIAGAISDLNQFKKVDVIIVSRGGGSIEDLWPFNEEIVARAVYNSEIPVVSAVGHQINTTLCDLAADIFVETPSAAAKIIVDRKNALLAEIDGLRHELNFETSEFISRLKQDIVALRHMLKSPQDRLSEKEQLLDELTNGLRQYMRHHLDMCREKANTIFERLDALSPLAVLSRGYSLSTLLSEGTIIKDAAGLKAGDMVKTILDKGSFISQVKGVMTDG